MLLAKSQKSAPTVLSVMDISLEKIKEDKPKIELEKPIQKEPIKLKTVSVTPPKIVNDAEVLPEESIKPIDALENVQISNFNQEGEQSNEMSNPPIEKLMVYR